LSILFSYLDNNSVISAVFGRVIRIDAEGKTIETSRDFNNKIYGVINGKVTRIEGANNMNFGHFITMSPISSPGQCLIRKSSFMQTEGFDPETNPCDDWDLWLQITRNEVIKNIPIDILKWRIHDDNVSKRHRLMQTKRNFIYKKYMNKNTQKHSIIVTTLNGYAFGMYGYDAKFCTIWFKDSLAEKRYFESIKYLIRSLRYTIKYLTLRALVNISLRSIRE
jgi:hypothetical protein